MCLDIFRDPGKALANAAKKKNMQKTWLVLAESSVMAALAMAIISLPKTGSIAASGMLVLNVFILIVAVAIIGGYVLKIVANTLGFKGGFFEGLSAVSYSFIPIGAGILATSVLSWLPLGIAIGAIILSVAFAMGVAIFYRGVKEMFRMDMITSFVAVSIITLAFVIGLYASLGLNTLANFGRLVPF
jgi:hypothetical protein